MKALKLMTVSPKKEYFLKISEISRNSINMLVLTTATTNVSELKTEF